MPDGLDLRRATDSDVAFLRRLYADSRAGELAIVPWPEAVLDAFLDSQFALQHRHYVTHFARADFFIVERQGVPVGRFYVDDRDDHRHVIDISLCIGDQGKGHGTRLMQALMSRAARARQSVTLQVSQANHHAQAFYRRLGFQVIGENGSHLAMQWIS
nr:GNAT family N-acetyltransferase [Luteibacter aegosomatis]